MLNTLMTVKAVPEQTGGAYCLLEQVVTTAGIGSPGKVAGFFAEVGEPAAAAELPPPAAPDVERVVAVATRHDIEIVAPPA
jgi:hypothetical protein